jgi:trimeric autotransporter adhesin
VEFSWTDGAGSGAGVSDHGALTGLADDDHPQYVPAEGARNSNGGFALVRSVSGGAIPATGPGTRMMWYPGKGALRAGGVLYDMWDDANVGNNSTAFGWNTMASGAFSFAAGVAAIASGDRSVALGQARASAYGAFAAGEGNASALYSVALGYGTAASGDYSTALGSAASANGKHGAFVYGDASTGSPVNALTDNHFVARAGRFWLGSDNNVTATLGRFIETSTGAFLSSGGTWTNSSDSAKKTGFRDVDGESILAGLVAMPVRTWTYRTEDSTVRHMGPTAQDFRTAFALGDGDKAIATVDADGVSLAAIQALVRRTDALSRENAALMRANRDLRAEFSALHEQTRQLGAELAQRLARSTGVEPQR